MLAQYSGMDPGDVRVDCLLAPAPCIVFLREMLAEHPSAEGRVIPRDLVALVPRNRRARQVREVCKCHAAARGHVRASLNIATSGRQLIRMGGKVTPTPAVVYTCVSVPRTCCSP